MKAEFDTKNNRLDISECPFTNIRVIHDEIEIVDIPLQDGCGFAENLPIESLYQVTYQPYNRLDNKND